jgi:hypothetical protein
MFFTVGRNSGTTCLRQLYKKTRNPKKKKGGRAFVV